MVLNTMLPRVSPEIFNGINASEQVGNKAFYEKLADENPVILALLDRVKDSRELSLEYKRAFEDGLVGCYGLLSTQAECDELRDELDFWR